MSLLADERHNRALADTIRAYWNRQGQEVRLELVTVEGFDYFLRPSGRTIAFGIRSNLVNGLPPAPCQS